MCSRRLNPCSAHEEGGPGGAICTRHRGTPGQSLALSPASSSIPSSIPAWLLALARPSLFSHRSSAAGLDPAASTLSSSRAHSRVQAGSLVAPPVHMHIASKECAFGVETLSSENYFIAWAVRIPRVKNESWSLRNKRPSSSFTYFCGCWSKGCSGPANHVLSLLLVHLGWQLPALPGTRCPRDLCEPG